MIDVRIGHPDEEMLERFLLHRSRADELENVETHILACQSCLYCLEAMKGLIKDLQVALATEREKEIGDEHHNPLRIPWKRWFTLPILSRAGAVCAALVLGLVLWAPYKLRSVSGISSASNKAEVVKAHFSANRGTNSIVLPIGRPLNLQLDMTDIAERPVNVQVVNGTGNEIWREQLNFGREGAQARLPGILTAGSLFLASLQNWRHKRA